MHFAEVIGKDKQRDGGFQVIPFAAESVRQARESADAHPYSEVGSLDVASADQFVVNEIKTSGFHG